MCMEIAKTCVAKIFTFVNHVHPSGNTQQSWLRITGRQNNHHESFQRMDMLTSVIKEKIPDSVPDISV